MSAQLQTIHLLAGLAAELNEAEAQVHSASQTLAGVKAQILYAISEASRPVDPAAPVDQGAPAPGKPPRPTEGGVAVTEGLAGPEEGGEGSADQGAGVGAVLGSVVISPKADQALDGASLEEVSCTTVDPRLAPGGQVYETIVSLYTTHGPTIYRTSHHFGIPESEVRSVLAYARRIGHSGVRKMDADRANAGHEVQ